MPAPWSSFSACLLAKNDRIGRDRLDLVNQGHVNPLGLHAPYALRHALCSLRSFCPLRLWPIFLDKSEI